MRVVFPFYYLPCLVCLAILQIASILIKSNVNTGQVIHGRVNRCNFEVDCDPSKRSNFDTTWLCCEDGTFWPSSHIETPMIVMFFLGSPIATAFFYYYWEALEAVSLTYLGSFYIYPTTLNQLETSAGSLIADGLMQGTLGLLLGSLISAYSGFPGLLPLVLQNDDGLLRWTGYRFRSAAVVWKYIGIFLLSIISFIAAGSATPDGSIVYGPYITQGVLFFLLTLFFPMWIKSDDAIGVDMHKTYRRAVPLLVICSFLIAFGSIGVHFLANDFYQSWLMYYVATLFVILWIRISPERVADRP